MRRVLYSIFSALRNRRSAVRFLTLAMVTVSAVPLLADTIAEQTAGTVNVKQKIFVGQSFTTPRTGPWHNITFSFFSDQGVTPTAGGTAYLFTSAYSGTPGGLSSSRYLAKSIRISRGTYVFDPSVTLRPNTRYFLYEDIFTASIPGGIDVSQTSMEGGNSFFCCLLTQRTFQARATSNTNFRVSGDREQPPQMAMFFLPSTVQVNGVDTLFFEITNPNPAGALTGIAITDQLPAGLVIAIPNHLANTCGGTASAPGGSSSITLSGATLATQLSCTVSVRVKATGAGGLGNTAQITSNQSGPGPAITAGVQVVAPGAVSKAFGAASIPLQGTTSLTFTVSNPNNGISLINMAFSDVLPSGLQVASPNHLGGSCITTQGAVVTATPGDNNISLLSLVLAGSTSCTISVDVAGVHTGTWTNISGPLSAVFDDGSETSVGITGAVAEAIIVVTPH